MDFDSINSLTDKDIQELYNNIIDNPNMIATFAYCPFYAEYVTCIGDPYGWVYTRWCGYHFCS